MRCAACNYQYATTSIDARLASYCPNCGNDLSSVKKKLAPAFFAISSGVLYGLIILLLVTFYYVHIAPQLNIVKDGSISSLFLKNVKIVSEGILSPAVLSIVTMFIAPIITSIYLKEYGKWLMHVSSLITAIVLFALLTLQYRIIGDGNLSNIANTYGAPLGISVLAGALIGPYIFSLLGKIPPFKWVVNATESIESPPIRLLLNVFFFTFATLVAIVALVVAFYVALTLLVIYIFFKIFWGMLFGGGDREKVTYEAVRTPSPSTGKCPFAGTVVTEVETTVLGMPWPKMKPVFKINDNWSVSLGNGNELGFIDVDGTIHEGSFSTPQPQATLFGKIVAKISGGSCYVGNKEIGKFWKA